MRSDVENPISNDVDIVSIPGQYLTEAVNWFKDNGIVLYGIQVNPEQHTWTTSPKAYGQLIIDDTSLGIPLRFDAEISNRLYVCRESVAKILERMKLI